MELEIKSIEEELKKYYPVKEGRKVTSALQEQILEVMTLMGTEYKTSDPESKKRFKYWIGRLKKYTPTQIYKLRKIASQRDNPAGFFNWLLARDNAERYL